MEKVGRYLRKLAVAGLTVKSDLTWFQRLVEAHLKKIFCVEVPNQVCGKIKEDLTEATPGGRTKSLEK